MIIGIDPHKASHTASALNPATNTTAAALRIDASLDGYRTLLAWSLHFEDRTWAVENAHGLGHHLAQWLISNGETVLDIPCTATARLRELSKGGSRKTDLIDAAAAASVAAWIGDASIVEAENYSTICSMLEERRSNVAQQRTRVANQLHAVLRELVAGGAPLKITTVSASALLGKVRPVNGVERVRKQMARDMVKDLKVEVFLTLCNKPADYSNRIPRPLDS